MAKKPSKKAPPTLAESFYSFLTKKRRVLTLKITKNTNPSVIYARLLVIALLLPLASWVIGGCINPHGWMSQSPLVAYIFMYIYFCMIPIDAWPVGYISILALLVVLLIIKQTRTTTFRVFVIIFFILCLVYSIFMTAVTSTASSSEFTG